MNSRGAGRYSQSRAELIDSAVHGPGSGTELILVEGESAQKAVAAVRSARYQAVLPLQGKPLNAWRATADKIDSQILFQQLASALGLARPTEWPASGTKALRIERLVLLFDPDADGIHIGALMQLYVGRWLRPLIEEGRLWLVRAPMFEITDAEGVVHHALSPTHRDRVLASLMSKPAQTSTLSQTDQAPRTGGPSASQPELSVRSIRGLAGLAPSVLSRLCVDPTSRLARAVTNDDLRDVVSVFGSES